MAVQTLFAKEEWEWNNKMDLWLKNGGGVSFYHFLELSEEEQEEIAVYLSLLPGEMEIKVKDKVFHLVHGFVADTLEKQVWTRPTLATENPFQDIRNGICRAKIEKRKDLLCDRNQSAGS